MPKVNMSERAETLKNADPNVDLRPFAHGYEWTCQNPQCDARDDPSQGEPRPARLFIRATHDRDEGPSNFDPSRQNIARPEQKQQPSEMNWNGLAEERGWKTSPVVLCPACQKGVTMAEYKEAKRLLNQM